MLICWTVKQPLCRLLGIQPWHSQCPNSQFQAAPIFVKIQSGTINCLHDVKVSRIPVQAMRRCCQIYFRTSFIHPGLRRLVAEERSTTVTLARVLPSLRETRADHRVGNSVPGRIIAFWERHNLSFLPAGSVRGVAVLVAYHRDWHLEEDQLCQLWTKT